MQHGSIVPPALGTGLAAVLVLALATHNFFYFEEFGKGEYLLKLEEIEPEFYVNSEKEISYSNKELIELLKSVLAKGLSFRFQAKGHSMSPFTKDGDVVTISALNNLSVGFGKLVAFIHSRTGKLVIHRVVGKSKKGYLIKGDIILQTDGLIRREDILGVVTKIERAGRVVPIGLGVERFIIVFLSQTRLLNLLSRIHRLFFCPVKKS